MPRSILSALIAILLSANAAAAQQDVRFERLRTGLDSMQIYLVRNGQPIHVGMLWDRLDVVEHEGAPAVRREYRTENRAFGPEEEVYLYRLPRLTAISVDDHGTSPQMLEYRADSVTGWRMEGSARRTLARVVGRDAYDGSVFDLLVRAGGLRPGYETEVAAYVSEMDSIVTLRARVTGSEAVQVEGGRMADTWVVEMDFAGLASTLWIDKETRALSRQTIELSPQITMLMDRLPVRDAEEREAR